MAGRGMRGITNIPYTFECPTVARNGGLHSERIAGLEIQCRQGPPFLEVNLHT